MKKDQIKKEQTKEPKEKKVKEVKSSVVMLSYEMIAVIPTVSYGNIQPRIMVNAKTIKEATDFILPHIEELYAKYCEVVPNFAKAPVVIVKEIPAEKPPESKAPEAKKQDVTHVSEPFTKAKKVVDSALSVDALNLISDKIKESTKLTGEEKDALMVILINKIKEFKK